MLGFIKRLFRKHKEDTPVTNQSRGVFFIYPEEVKKDQRDGPELRPATPTKVERYLEEIAERKRQFQEWKETNNRLFGVA